MLTFMNAQHLVPSSEFRRPHDVIERGSLASGGAALTARGTLQLNVTGIDGPDANRTVID